MHNTNSEEDEDNSFKGKIIAFFDIERDPLVKWIKKKIQKEE